MVKNVVVYIRRSSGSKEDNESLKRQNSYLKDWLEKNNDVKVLRKFEEVVSGSVRDRKEFLSMLEFIENENVNIVWCWKWDRMERNMRNMIDFKDVVLNEFNKNGREIKVYEYSNNKYYKLWDKGDSLNIGIRSLISEEYRKDVEYMIKEGRIRGLKKGKDNSGLCLFGYERDDEMYLVENKKESFYVKWLFEKWLYKKYKYVNELYSDYNKLILSDLEKGKLNEKEYKRYKKGIISVRELLENKSYIGNRVVNYLGEEYKIKIDGIIELDLFNKVKEKLDSRRYNKKNNKFDRLLDNVNVCCNDSNCLNYGNIKGIYSSRYSKESIKKGKYGDGIMFFYCCYYGFLDESGYKKRRKLKNSECNNDIRIDYLEEFVFNNLFYKLLNSEKEMSKWKEKYDSKKSEKGKYVGRRKYYEKQINSFDLKKKKFDELFMKGKIDEKELEEKYDFLNNEKQKYIDGIERNESEIIKIEKSEDLKNYVDNMIGYYRRLFNNNRKKDKKDLLRKYIKEIRVKKISGNRKLDKIYDIEVDYNLYFDDSVIKDINIKDVDRLKDENRELIDLDGKKFLKRIEKKISNNYNYNEMVTSNNIIYSNSKIDILNNINNNYFKMFCFNNVFYNKCNVILKNKCLVNISKNRILGLEFEVNVELIDNEF